MSMEGLGTDVLCQVGLVVRDIEKSAEACSRILGLPVPPVRVTDAYDLARTTYRGQPTQARAKLAFFQLGQVALELIEPIGGPSTWREFLDEKGEGVHHIAFVIQGTNQVLAFLAGQGIGVLQQGQYSGGMYSYVDSAPALGVILELLENFAGSEDE